MVLWHVQIIKPLIIVPIVCLFDVFVKVSSGGIWVLLRRAVISKSEALALTCSVTLGKLWRAHTPHTHCCWALCFFLWKIRNAALWCFVIMLAWTFQGTRWPPPRWNCYTLPPDEYCQWSTTRLTTIDDLLAFIRGIVFLYFCLAQGLGWMGQKLPELLAL